MPRFFSSLLFKISLAILLTETVVLAALGTYYVKRFSDQIDDRILAKLRIPGTLMDQQQLNYETVRDKEALRRLVGEDIVEAFVIRKDGKIFYSMRRELEGKRMEDLVGPQSASRLRVERTEELTQRSLSSGKASMTVISPLHADNQLIGSLHIVTDTSSSEAEKHSLATLFAVSSGVCILVTTLAGVLLINAMAGPRIAKTVQCLKAVEAGDHHARIALTAHTDEISDLQRSINTMLEEVEKRTEELRQAQKMEAIGRLAGGIAHDFNNLLTGILGNVSLELGRSNPREAQYDTWMSIRQAAESAAGLTRQLLAFSRKQMIEPRVLNLNELIERTHRLLSPLIGEHIALRIIPGANLGNVRVDPVQIEQILVNLALNARDAMPDGGELTIETSNLSEGAPLAQSRRPAPPNAYVRLIVRDTGQGMDEQVLSHLFEPFFTTKPQGKGSGLGLAMVYGAVQQHAGTIEVISRPGAGAAFLIDLPRVAEPVATLPKPTMSDELPRGEETILLVEDEQIVRDLAVKVLRLCGYRVLSASNGIEALHVAETHAGTIEMLVTDVVMPGLNGTVLAERLKEKRPDLRVLLASGYSEDLIAKHGAVDERIHFIPKPYTPQMLAGKVREILDLVRPPAA